MNNAIKLLKVGEAQDGTERLQSQLYVGKSTCDFIKHKDENFVNNAM